MNSEKLQQILDFLNNNDNLQVVFDLIIRKDIQMFKYIDSKAYYDLKNDIWNEARESMYCSCCGLENNKYLYCESCLKKEIERKK